MGPIGVQEMIAIFVIALVLFGPKKLPELGRMLGKGLSEFRRAKSELKATFESHLNELERETRLPTQVSSPSPYSSPTTDYSSTSTDYSAPRYSYPYEDQGTYETGNSHEVVPSDSLGSNHAPEHADAELQPVQSVPHAQPVSGTVARGSSTLREEPPA